MDAAASEAQRAITAWVIDGGMNCGCCREGAKRLKVPVCPCSGGVCACDKDCEEECGCCLCECHKQSRDFDAIKKLEEAKNAALHKADSLRDEQLRRDEELSLSLEQLVRDHYLLHQTTPPPVDDPVAVPSAAIGDID